MKDFLNAVQKVREDAGWMLELDWQHLNPPLTAEQDKDIDEYLSAFEKKEEGKLFSVHNRLFVYLDNKKDVHALMKKVQFCNELTLLTAGQEICRPYIPEKDRSFLRTVFEETIQEGEVAFFPFFEENSAFMTPEILGVFEDIFASVDMTPFLRKQSICLIGEKVPPLPIAEEVFISVPELKKTVYPLLDIQSDPWLYQRWCQKLDIAYLQALLSYPFPVCGLHINLSVVSLLTQEFKSFDAHLTGLQRHNTALELALPDVMTYFKTFEKMMPVLKKRGYQIVLDKVTPKAYALLKPEMLNVDKIKLWWSSEFYRTVSDAAFLKRLKETGTAKIILAHVDDKNAMPIGSALGITQYQGYHIQKLLFKASRFSGIYKKI